MNPSISTHEDRSVYANKIGSLLHQQNSMYPIVTNLIWTSTPKPSVYIWLNRKLVSHSTEGTATVSSAERPICSGSIQRPDHSMFSIRLGFILTLWTTSPSLGGQLRLIAGFVPVQGMEGMEGLHNGADHPTDQPFATWMNATTELS